MNILMTAQAYYPFCDKGGPAVKVRAIALGLAKLGHSVAILTSDWGFQPSMAPTMSSGKCRLGWCAEESGVTTFFLRSVGRYRALSFNPDVLTFSSHRIRGYDVVHVYGLYDLLGPAVTFFCRSNHIPYVVEPMGMFRPIVRNIGLKKLYHRVLGKKLLGAAECLIATSDQEKRELLAEGIDPNRIIVRRNGVELPPSLPEPGGFRAQWNIPRVAKLVLFLGRLEAKKSPELLLTAFAEWRDKSHSAAPSFLAIAGPEQQRGYSSRLLSLASSLGIADSVRVTGPLYDEKKWSAYRDADVFVLPSQNENFGNSAAEAMACSTPVIVTDQCGIAPLVADKTGLVVAHNASAIANALQLILEDPIVASRFRSACPAVVSGLSWEEPILQMLSVYQDAAQAN